MVIKAARKRRQFRKPTRVTARDGLPRWCIATIAVPDTERIAARLIVCKRARGHDGSHHNRKFGAWTNEDAAAADELWAAHNRWMRGQLPYLPRPPRKQRVTKSG